MKFNWGTGIAIFYSSFVLIMIVMVVKSSQVNINMVQDNYYDQDLNYESFRKSRENGNAADPLMIEYQVAAKNVKIQFPLDEKNIKGDVKLYRPSNNQLDKLISLKLDEENKMDVSVDHLSRGYWKIIVNWDVDGKRYFKEQQLIL